MHQFVQNSQLLPQFWNKFLFLQSFEILRVKKGVKDTAYKGHLRERLNSLETLASEPGIYTVMGPDLVSYDCKTFTVSTTLEFSFLL